MIYFAYGSNLSLEQMKERCVDAKVLKTAVLKDHRLAFGGYSNGWGGAVATIVPCWGEEVHGVLYDLPEKSGQRLDAYEGHPHVYKRSDVTMDCGSKAITYVLEIDEEKTPSRLYFSVIWNAYVAYSFDTNALLEAGRIPLGKAAKHKVFVYGTLKRGFGNHHLIKHATFLGQHRTVTGFNLYSFGWYPALFEGGGCQVSGELYEVDDETLENMDRLESHPEYYVRKPIMLENGDKVLGYVMRDEYRDRRRKLIRSGTWEKRA